VLVEPLEIRGFPFVNHSMMSGIVDDLSLSVERPVVAGSPGSVGTSLTSAESELP
jgi:hypothetical protein